MSVNILNKRLPAEYQEVEYIESTGEQCIDTGYLPVVGDALIIEQLKCPQNGLLQTIFSAGTGTHQWILINAETNNVIYYGTANAKL